MGLIRNFTQSIKFRINKSNKKPENLALKRNRLQLGSPDWLIATEAYYGGYLTNIHRRKVSDLDDRSPEKIATGGMTGGDRMYHHGYAPHYSHYLNRFFKDNNFSEMVVCEIGILKGTGLAIWCDLFPNNRILGLDIDISHTSENLDNLLSLGAFKKGKPELYEFDQLNPDTKFIKKILKNKKISICIDDGLHSEVAIMTTIKCIRPFLDKNFVYFIEDNSKISKTIRSQYKEFKITAIGELTILTAKKY